MKLPSLFGWLDNFDIWRNLSYPIKGAILRAAKAVLSVIIGALVAALGSGTLFPEGTSTYVIVVVTALIQAGDKFLREWQDAKDNPEDAAELEGAVVNTDTTLSEQEPVNTDATTAVEKPASKKNGGLG